MPDIGSIKFDDPEYPELLKEITAPPETLFYRGNPDLVNGFCLAVVGTRRMSLYAQIACRRMVTELASAGVVIVSGLAYGIDSVAHQAALEVGGKTVAVLGAGISRGVARSQQLLFDEISQKGLVLSEFQPDYPPNKWTFVQRNRIISGLCRGTLMVEGDYTSGAMITAKYALDQNREVFALPGRVDSLTARGGHWLIKNGAKLIENAQDVLDEFAYLFPKSQLSGDSTPGLNADEKAFYEKIKTGVSSETLIENLGQRYYQLATQLELKGLARLAGGKLVALK